VSSTYQNSESCLRGRKHGRGRSRLQPLVCGGAGVLARALLTLTMTAAAFSQSMTGGIMGPPATLRPPGLTNVGLQQRLNEQLPLGLAFRDETGKAVRLGDYFGKKPVILNFVYYRCPMLCSELLTGLESTLKVLNFDVGKEFDVVTVSFDPKDTPELATAKKAAILKRYKRAGAEQGWHFLTGPQESISTLTKAAGFEYQYDPKTDQFAHTTAIMVVTPEGKLSKYYYGVEFPPKDLRLGLIEASENRIGTLADQIILYCFHYDPQTGKYSVIISRVIQLSGGLTILGIGAVLLILFRRGPDHDLRRQGSSHQYVR
jgi:protein SCO1/2